MEVSPSSVSRTPRWVLPLSRQQTNADIARNHT
jgi:hypothetical protein